MRKRSFKRIPAEIRSTILYDNILYGVTILNLSEKGMFIRSKVHFPSEATVAIRIGGAVIPADVKWIQKKRHSYIIGVELLDSIRDFGVFAGRREEKMNP